MDAVTSAPIGLGRQAWNVARHYLEMCISMCVVGTPLTLLLFVWGPSAIGSVDLRQQLPELSVLAIAVIYTVPMVVWMRFRGMDWRPVLEMGGATIAVGFGLVALARLGILSAAGLSEFASIKFCSPACVVMFLVMLPRLGMYTGRSGHQMGHGVHAAHAM